MIACLSILLFHLILVSEANSGWELVVEQPLEVRLQKLFRYLNAKKKGKGMHGRVNLFRWELHYYYEKLDFAPQSGSVSTINLVNKAFILWKTLPSTPIC